MIRKLLLSFCFLCAVSVGTCSAQEQEFQISNSNLMRLEQIFDQLEKNSIEQEKRLKEASESLSRSNNQIKLLEMQLLKAENSINQANLSLEKVNESFKKYEAEAKREIDREKSARKSERLLWIIGSTGLLWLTNK